MDTYNLDFETQVKILAMACQDPSFLLQYRECINADFFTQESLVRIAAVILDHFDRYDDAPDRTVIRQMIKDRHNDFDENELEALIDALFHPQYDAGFVRDAVIEFAKRAAWKEHSLRSIDLIESGEWEEKWADIEKGAMDALSIGDPQLSIGYEWRSDLRERILNLNKKVPRVPTMIRGLDEAINGGLAEGELGIVIAPTSGFKSTLLMNFAATALLQNKSVYVSTHEIRDVFWGRRLDCRLTGMNFAAMNRNPSMAIKRMETILKKYRAKIIIKEFPSGQATWQQVKRNINLWRRRGYHFDLIIVDYLEELRTTISTRDRHDLSLKSIAQGLRAIGQELKVPVWTAQQARWQAENRDRADWTYAANSKGTVHVSDVTLTINQTRDEKEANEARLYVTKNREGRNHVTIPVSINPDYFRISENP